MATLVRRGLRTVTPRVVRRFAWWVRNLFSYAVSERAPIAPTLDYEQYWQWRLAQGAIRMTHPELVDICAELVPDGSLVLDIGCGSGEFISALQSRKQLSVIGTDVSESAVALARQKGLDARVIDVRKGIDISEHVDFVPVFEVIEHLAEPERLFLNLKTLNCPIIVSIPNTGYISSRLRLLLGRFPRQWIYHPGEHLRFWTLRDFQLMCTYLGFKIEQIIGLKGHETLQRHWPGLFAQYLVFVLRPQERPLP